MSVDQYEASAGSGLSKPVELQRRVRRANQVLRHHAKQRTDAPKSGDELISCSRLDSSAVREAGAKLKASAGHGDGAGSD